MRLIPILFISYIIAYIDRVNISFAALRMPKHLSNDHVMGLGAGLFFIGYFILEIPATMMVERYSARKIIARIMITWGIVAALNGFVTTAYQFYGVRFLLGLAEAGFFPGVIIFLSRWFVAKDRARALALFLMATPVAQVISPLVCRPLLNYGATEVVNGVPITHELLFGLHGWQLVFVVWGLPAVLLGLVVLFMLSDWPREAKWLTGDEKVALQAEIDRERALQIKKRHLSLGQALRQPKVLALAAAYFFVVTANYGTEFFLPKMMESWFHLSLNTLVLFMVLPPLVTLAAQWFVGYNSDRTRERRLHSAIPIGIGALCLAIAPFSIGSFAWAMSLLVVARAGIKAYQPAFWTLPTLLLPPGVAAGCVGFINSVGNLGGFVGPKVLGDLAKSSGGYALGTWFMAGMMAVSTVIILTMQLDKSETSPASAP